MKYLKKINHFNYIKIIIFIVMTDILSKYWILNHIKINQQKKVFSILNLLHIHNYGVAFSFLSHQGEWKRWVLSIISVFTIIIMSKITIKLTKKDKNKKISYCLIIAGAIGNVINRISYGFVIDFIDLHINDWHFATFNIADLSIFTGILILTKINYKNY